MHISPAVPILRFFDEAKMREFYLGFLGMTVDWEHRFDDDAPLYLQVSRTGMTLHLTEHHGDATPGSCAFVPMTGIEEFHAELTDKDYRNNRPGLVNLPWGRQVEVTDPSANRLRFCELKG
ncbi:VOC family protein [Massilia arenosa]|uniref:VOC family protein n=1 Tax=Zemynaea arenosa TaxID=2561931 RepID=A0A4Y9SNS7_9BURK|nr:glyoxalase superfamily protein [Massilia arenosa]TFW26594.1 VOC family protein [Massilia arenosa]